MSQADKIRKLSTPFIFITHLCISSLEGGLYTQPSSGFPTAAPGLGYGISNSMMGAQPIQNGVYAVPGLGSQPLAATVPVPGIASNPFFNMGTPAAAFPVMSQVSPS
ncbi:unnamed protein product [Timema podura]|uniref:Uncharacterized protein n=1 Tax=Timema podura TaxID=61482 RepID=A0ABN7PLA7_TIMPD|nr:unnamed protein product [Timema podura]